MFLCCIKSDKLILKLLFSTVHAVREGLKFEALITLHNKACGHLATDLLQQSDLHLHGLRQLVDYKSVTSCEQTGCKFSVKTCHPKACCKLFQQVVTSLQMTSDGTFVPKTI